MTRLFATICFGICCLGAALPARGFSGVDIPMVKKMAEQGDADAQSKLGVLYAQGMWLKKDRQEAVRWYRKAADQGYPVGQWNLAFAYIKGEGVAVDFQKARQLFRKAAESGFVNAQYDLGMMLLQGLGGEQDLKEAKGWFQVAAGSGYPEAVNILTELDPDQDRGADKDSGGLSKEELLQ